MTDPIAAKAARDQAFADMLAKKSDLLTSRFTGIPAPIASAVVDGWRSQLQAGHARTLELVANSMTSTIALKNLDLFTTMSDVVGRAGADVIRAAKELSQRYETDFGLAIRETVMRSIKPAALASASAMMERLKASNAVQIRYEEALRRLGWWVPPNISMDFFWEVGRLAEQGKRVAVRREMADAAKSPEFRRTVEGWMDLGVFRSRRLIIRDGLQDHRRGRYRVSIPTLLPQIEGITFAAFEPAMRMGPDLIDTASTTYHAVMGPAMVEAVGVLWESKAFSDFNPRALNRHFILHGRSTAYATEENSVKVLFALDLLASIVQEAERHPARNAGER